MVAVAITRTEPTAADLRGAAARARDADAVRRMLALALVLEGRSRAEAAEACGMDRQTLRDWVHRHNAEGLAGLSDRRPPGRKPHLTPEQQAEVGRWVERGPDLETDGVVRWRRVDLRARIARAFAVRLHPATVGKLLRQLTFRRLSVRPRHPRSDPAEQEAFRGASPSGRRPSSPRPPGASRSRSGSAMVGSTASNRVGQQGTLTRVWARRGTRPRAPRDRRYTSAWLFGAVCPARRGGAAVVMPEANTEAMEAHLAEIGRRVSPGAHAVLVLDGAGWHGAAKLRIPGNISLLLLPPYSPELNPVETIWEFLRQNLLSHRVWESYDAIVGACCAAWNWLMQMPDQIATITARAWAQVTL